MGVTGMRERARMFGAVLTLAPAEPSGTVIRLEYNLAEVGI
jgi:signal transduction histidine kinase